MIRRIIPALLVFLTLPAPAFAWGYDGHHYIMRRAIELLPSQLKPFYEAHEEEIVLRVVDPDLWRLVGWEDDPHHFVDFGAREYGAYPFTELPRDYSAALEKFGIATLKRNGLLPWWEQEQFGNVRRAFEGFKGQSEFAVTNLVLFSAVMSHYIQDATQPLHATINFNGQQTGQIGVHGRFETDLFDRYMSKLVINPAPPNAMTNARDAAFDTLIASYQLVDALLKADRDASAGKDTYDDEYFDKFFVAVRPMLERQISLAITNTAGLIMGAWELAGKPALRIKDAHSVQKVRKLP